MKAFLLVALLLAVLACSAHGQSLAQIRNNIAQYQAINSTTIGAALANQLSTDLNISFFGLANISFSLTSNLLTVTANTKLYSIPVVGKFLFYYVGNDLETGIQFVGSGSFSQFYSIISRKSPPSIFSDFQGTDQVSFSYATNGQYMPQGVTIAGAATITGGDLLKAIQYLHPGSTSLGVKASLYLPLTPSLSTFTLTIKELGAFTFKTDIDILSFVITVSYTTSLTITLEIDTNIFVENPVTKQMETLDVDFSANYQSSDSQISFEGQLLNAWTNPLGLKWLSITSGTVTMVIGSNVFDLQIDGQCALTWGGNNVAIAVIIGGPDGLSDVLFQVSNLQVTNNNMLAEIYAAIAYGSTAPSILAQLTVSNQLSFTVSTFNDPSLNAQEGVTLSMQVTVNDNNNLMKAVQILKNNANSETFDYTLQLYIPVFNIENAATTFSLTETGQFTVFSGLICDSFAINVVLQQSGVSIAVSGVFEALLKSQTVKFSLSGTWQESQSSITFNGQLLSPWVNPLSLSWLTINSASVNLILSDNTAADSLTLQGSASLKFEPASPVTVTVEISGPDFEDILIAVTNIPFDALTLGLFYMEITGSYNIPTDLLAIDPQGTASIAVATYNAGQYQEGLTLQVNVKLKDAGNYYQAVRVVTDNPTQYIFNLKIYIGVFSGGINQIQLTLSETGAIALTSTISILQYTLQVTIDVASAGSTISISAEAAVDLPRENQVLDFMLSAVWQDEASITLSGALVGDWNDPFGAKWMDITSMNINIVIDLPALVQSVVMKGAAKITFSSTSTADGSFLVALSDDFTAATFEVSVTNSWTAYQIGQAVLGTAPSSYLNDVSNAGTTTLTLAISTDSYGGFQPGFTAQFSGQITGSLLAEMKKKTYWWSADIGTVAWAIDLYIPIFSDAPEDIQLTLTFSEQIQLNSHLYFESLQFYLDLVPLSFGLTVDLKAMWNKNPPMNFILSGSYTTDEILLSGTMEGDWVDPFGIKGFVLEEVIGELGFSPAMCGVDLCISDLGLGAKMVIGGDTINFDGNVAAPDFYNIFLAGSISSSSGVILSVLDVAEEWNAINPDLPIDTSLIPPTWGLTNAAFYFAPVDGTFGPIHYTAGFGITGGIVILDMSLEISINCTFTSCAFSFDVDVSKETFAAMIAKELSANPAFKNVSFDIFSVQDVSLSEWSQQGVATGTQPRWIIDIVVFNSPNHLDFHIHHQYDLADSFHDFFNEWLASIFGAPQVPLIAAS